MLRCRLRCRLVAWGTRKAFFQMVRLRGGSRVGGQWLEEEMRFPASRKAFGGVCVDDFHYFSSRDCGILCCHGKHGPGLQIRV